mmetsp:Transcript_11881/g.26478  ORF Transcript_11881/g.26478 Transcript_11881/m.26478 type:complete len:131 (+) Transcript_11881:24-416(+)
MPCGPCRHAIVKRLMVRSSSLRYSLAALGDLVGLVKIAPVLAGREVPTRRMMSSSQSVSSRSSIGSGNKPTRRPPTAFEQRVYAACRRIPKGYVASYGVLAASLEGGAGMGCPRSVGGAMRRNPYAPDVP